MVDEFIGNLGDIPDLSGFEDDTKPEPFADGWYAGTVLAKRAFTDSNGNDRVFESNDEPAQKSGRNIRLQVELRRKSDGRALNISFLTNYQPEDLTQETVQRVIAHKEKVKNDGEEWGPLFRAFASLNRLAALQRVAGVRQFQRNGNGGLDLSPIYGKSAYFRIKPDSRNAIYKEIAEVKDTAPARAKVL